MGEPLIQVDDARMADKIYQLLRKQHHGDNDQPVIPAAVVAINRSEVWRFSYAPSTGQWRVQQLPIEQRDLMAYGNIGHHDQGFK